MYPSCRQNIQHDGCRDVAYLHSKRTVGGMMVQYVLKPESVIRNCRIELSNDMLQDHSFPLQSVNGSLHELYRDNIETTSSRCPNLSNDKMTAIPPYQYHIVSVCNICQPPPSLLYISCSAEDHTPVGATSVALPKR